MYVCVCIHIYKTESLCCTAELTQHCKSSVFQFKKMLYYRTITRNFIFMYMNMLKIDIFTTCHRALKWVLLRKGREGIGPAVHKWGVKGKEPCAFPLPLWDLPAEVVNGWGAQTLESEDEGLDLSSAITCWAVLGSCLVSLSFSFEI